MLGQEARSIIEEAKLAEAKSLALSYLSKGRKTTGKMRDYLWGKGVSKEYIREVICDLWKNGRLDDYDYAADFIESRRGRKSESANVLRIRLRHLGFMPVAIEHVLKDYDDEEACVAFLNALTYKEKEEFKKLWKELGTSFAYSSELKRFLRKASGRGFSVKLVLNKLKTLFSEENI